MNCRKSLSMCALGLMMFGVAAPAWSYGFFKNTAGRKDFNSRYDLAGRAYPGQANAVFDFGKFGNFSALPFGVTAANVLSAVQGAASDWSQYGKFKFDTTGLGASGNGLVRFAYDAGKPSGAAVSTVATGGGDVDYATMTFGQEAAPGVAWNATNFAWVVKHEMGHVLGLDDMYEPYVEDFVDHGVNQADVTNKNPLGYKDNIMMQYRYDGNDYSRDPQTIIDNDEIAAITWLWGSDSNQIVTGRLKQEWNGSLGRDTLAHHGGNNAKTWNYRVSVTGGGTDKPYVDIYFPGFTGWFGLLYSSDAPPLSHESLGNDMHRFKVDKVGWGGNMTLNLTSKFSDEQRVPASVISPGKSHALFTLNPNTDGLTLIGHPNSQNNVWAKVYGPVPEPGTWIALGLGLGALVAPRRRRN